MICVTVANRQTERSHSVHLTWIVQPVELKRTVEFESRKDHWVTSCSWHKDYHGCRYFTMPSEISPFHAVPSVTYRRCTPSNCWCFQFNRADDTLYLTNVIQSNFFPVNYVVENPFTRANRPSTLQAFRTNGSVDYFSLFYLKIR